MFDQEVSSNLGPLAWCWWVSVLLTPAQIHSWLPQDASWALEHRGSTLLLVVHLILTPLHSSLHYQKEPKLCPVPGPLPQQLPLKKKKTWRVHPDQCRQSFSFGFLQHRPGLPSPCVYYTLFLCIDSVLWQLRNTRYREKDTFPPLKTPAVSWTGLEQFHE